MFVKSLTLRGFKSFASATTMEFEPGIIAIIGPNGSGKSNIVDALGWVMGEQGAKSLRGQSMSDVIFAGTTSRQGLGRAQVELTIDNSSGLLPIDYTEVTISRTIFRSGGSEYSLNGTQCRLLDIQELLSDSGMGKNMHVIVGQGQLDEVLSADPLVRRSYIEEAAGVLKHRRRKDRALSKLDSTMEKLSRLEDLTREIRRQMGPLARQATAAKKALVIQATIRDASSRLQADSIMRAREELTNRLRDRDAIHKVRQELRRHMEALEGELSQLDSVESGNSPGSAAQLLTSMWHEQSQLQAQLHNIEQLTQERHQSLAKPIAGARVDDDAFRHMIDQAKTKIAQAENDQRDLQSKIEAADTRRNDAEQAFEYASQERSRFERTIGDQREQLARLEGELEAKLSKLTASQEQHRNTLVQQEDAQQRLEQATQALSAAPVVDDEETHNLSQTHADLVTEQQNIESRLNDARAVYQKAVEKLATWNSREQTLSDSIAAHNGGDDILGANLPGVDTPLAQELTIKRGWEDATAAFLGDMANALIAHQDDAAITALRYARDNSTGKVSFLIDRVPPSLKKETLPKDLPKFAVPMASLIGSKNKKLSDVVDFLCSNVVAVDDLDQAQDIISKYPQITVVTRHGETLGAIRATGGVEETVLRLHAEHAKAQEGAKAANVAVEAAQHDVDNAQKAKEKIATEVDEVMTQIRAADAKSAKEAEEVARLTARQQLAQAEVERLSTLAKDISERMGGEESSVEAQRDAIEDFRSKMTKPGEGAQELEEAYENARVQASKIREELTDLQLQKRSADERYSAACQHLKALETQWEEQRNHAERMKKREAERQERVAVLAQVHELAVAGKSITERLYSMTDQQRREASLRQEEYSKKARELRNELHQTSREYERKTDEVHQRDVAAAEHRLRLEQLEERARQELSTEPDVLIAEYGPHMLVPLDVEAAASDNNNVEDGDEDSVNAIPYVRAEQQERLHAAQKKLSRLGTINPLAMEEYKALEQRYEFMTTQVNDVKKSRTDLLHIIEEVDEQVKTAFENAYRDTAESFEQVFSQLFPGGQGNLVLTDPDNWLETGVDIEARPAGKKVKRLSLLSGGERSLSALAFLIALFKARPSPFYILDEVEAALDDVNLSRVLKVFEELREISQLLVITHQKRTMAIADALYGVSMRDGVTKVVSHKLHSEDAE